jgi:hypothetical protein
MVEILVEPEFSAWVEALPDPFAEEVTAALELTASAGPALAPERLSRLLLWYDGTGTGTELVAGAAGQALALRVAPGREVGIYLGFHHDVVQCLESEALRQRLARLPDAPAAHALLLVERLKRLLQAARFASSHAPRGGSSWEPLRATFAELLGLLGLSTREALGSESGLRELAIRNVRPEFRVLIGLDHGGRRLLAILGETLDRAYYGDSVRRAEKRWRGYLERQLDAREAR